MTKNQFDYLHIPGYTDSYDFCGIPYVSLMINSSSQSSRSHTNSASDAVNASPVSADSNASVPDSVQISEPIHDMNTVPAVHEEVKKEEVSNLNGTDKNTRRIIYHPHRTLLYDPGDGTWKHFQIDSRIFYIDHDYRDTLENTMDKNDTTPKDRPYLAIRYTEDMMTLIPMRSSCDPTWPTALIFKTAWNIGKHRMSGLDFSKMLFVWNDDLLNVLTFRAEENPAYIKSIYGAACHKIDSSIRRFCHAAEINDKDPAKVRPFEKYLLRYSTLVNYQFI